MLVDHQTSCQGCKYGEARSAQYKSFLVSKGNGPLQMIQKPIGSLLKEIEKSMPSRRDVDQDLSPRTSCNYYPYNCRHDRRKDFSNKLEELRAAWGLSYEEVRSEQTAAEHTK